MGAILVDKSSSLPIRSNLKNYYVSQTNNITDSIKKISGSKFLIVDKEVFNKYSQFNNLSNTFDGIIKLRPSEKVKEYSFISKIIQELLRKGIKKNSKLIVVGGGVTQDVAGYISSILFRGITWVFFPSTLLAQGDSCIGSKTSINFLSYKNQIGTFYPPDYIYIYLPFLKTLKNDEILSGLGEMSHYFIIGGSNKFKIFEQMLSEKKINFNRLIFESLKIKKKYIELDEFDNNKRNFLNYGHTFGHAIESVTNYKIPHGIAVSIGIDIINYIAVEHKEMKKKDRERIKKTLLKIYGNINLKKINYKKLFEVIKKDKKSFKDSINLIICKSPGKIFIKKFKLDKKLQYLIINYFETL